MADRVVFAAPERPSCEQYLFGMSVGQRLLGGAALLLGGVVVTIALWDLGWVWKGSIAAMVFGVGSIVTGHADRKRKLRLEAEVDRAMCEWDELCRSFGTARGRGENVAVLLQKRGYREFNVRRWIMREIDGIVARARAAAGSEAPS